LRDIDPSTYDEAMTLCAAAAERAEERAKQIPAVQHIDLPRYFNANLKSPGCDWI